MTFHTFIFWSKWAQEPGFTPVPPWRENDGETWRTQKRSADWSGKQTQAEKNFLVPWRSNFYHQVMIVGYCKRCWSKGTHSLLNIFFGFPFQVWIWLWFLVLQYWPHDPFSEHLHDLGQKKIVVGAMTAVAARVLVSQTASSNLVLCATFLMSAFSSQYRIVESFVQLRSHPCFSESCKTRGGHFGHLQSISIS